MKSITIYKNGDTHSWYTLEQGKYTKEKLTLKYLEKDIKKLINMERGWELGWVLRNLLTEQIKREGKEEILRKLL